MSGRQLGVVELGTDLFGQSVKTGRWPCEFVWGNGTEEVVVLRGEWMKDSAELDLDEDGKLRTIVELPVGNHRFEFVRNEEVIYENEVEVKELDQSINRFSSTVFGGDALKNVADHKGAATGARQLGDGSVEFTYNDVSYAKRVWVVGDFVTEPLELQKEDTGYKVTTVVEPGKHEFRFRVDIGEALTAEAGPQSRLGWHAGTTTGKYLSTNLQEFSVDKSKLTADSTSKPKNQVKKTSLAAVANAAKAVVRTKDVTKNHDSTDRESSPTVEEVKSVLEAADRRAEYNNVDQITPTNVSRKSPNPTPKSNLSPRKRAYPFPPTHSPRKRNPSIHHHRIATKLSEKKRKPESPKIDAYP